MTKEDKMLELVQNFFTSRGYKIISVEFIPEHNEEYVDDFTEEPFVENVNSEYNVRLDRRFSLRDKKNHRDFQKISDMFYMSFNGTILKLV